MESPPTFSENAENPTRFPFEKKAITLEDIIENFIEKYVKSSRAEGYYIRCQLAKKKLYEFFGKKNTDYKYY